MDIYFTPSQCVAHSLRRQTQTLAITPKCVFPQVAYREMAHISNPDLSLPRFAPTAARPRFLGHPRPPPGNHATPVKGSPHDNDHHYPDSRPVLPGPHTCGPMDKSVSIFESSIRGGIVPANNMARLCISSDECNLNCIIKRIRRA